VTVGLPDVTGQAREAGGGGGLGEHRAGGGQEGDQDGECRVQHGAGREDHDASRVVDGRERTRT
jgi:hypothetical protein